jgi:hypothetical protein
VSPMTSLLVDQLDRHWTTQLRPRLDHLTDDEYLWEPVAGCWSIRPRAQAMSGLAAGGRDVVMDFARPEPDPPPVTTIAWRMAHIAVAVFGMRVAAHFDGPAIHVRTVDYPMTAANGLALLDEHHRAWTGHLRSIDDDRLWQACGPAEGPYADLPFAGLVLHLNREAIHHGAEIALLRDLYRASDGGRAWNAAPDGTHRS